MKNLLNKIWNVFTDKQKKECTILLIVLILMAFMELIGVSVILPFISFILDPESFEKNTYIQILKNIFGVTTSLQIIILLSIIIIVLYVFKNICLSIAYKVQYNFIYKNQQVLACRILKNYLNREFLFFVKNDSSQLIRNINLDVEMFFTTVLSVLSIFSELCICVVLAIFLLVQDVGITVLAFFVMGVITVLYSSISKKLLIRLGEKMRISNGMMLKWLQQIFGGIKEIKLAEKEEFFEKEYRKSYSSWAKSRSVSLWISSLVKPIMETFCMVLIILIVLVKLVQGESAITFIPMLSVFAVAAVRILPSFNKITQNISYVLYNQRGVETVYDSICEDKNINKNLLKKKTVGNLEFKKTIEINDLTFKYNAKSSLVLEKISILMPYRKSIAFIGPSGAGKTTLIDIILGLLIPQSGEVLVDGVNIQRNMHTWHKMVGYIPQSIYLLDDTIYNNIALGVEDEEIDLKKIERVIRDVQLEQFIKDLPDGYHTVVGERGIALSGGQKQRIAIARALYREPEILILDEATSALDHETEKAVMQSINKWAGKKTLIIIAHRLSTIEQCDMVYEVKEQSVNRIR